MHPRSKHWHQIDFIIWRRRDLRDFHITRAMRDAECSKDHILLRWKVNLQVRRKRRPRGKKPSKKLGIRNISDPSITIALQNELSRPLEQVAFAKGETEENWAKLRNEFDSAAKKTIEVLKRHHQDWFDDNASEIQSLLAEKYAAHRDWLADKQSASKRDKFHRLRGKVQKRLRSMKDEWWKKKAGEIQIGRAHV